MAESLSIMVNQIEHNQWLHGIHINGVMERIIVFQYIDDTILFMGHSENLEVRLGRCLFIFSIISDLHINLHMSYLIGVGVDPAKLHSIVSTLWCQIRSLLIRYLGLQLEVRRRDI